MSNSDDIPDETSTTSRRRFLGVSLGLGGLGALCGLETFWLEPDRLEVTRHDVPVPGLPGALDGYTIAHLTDLHFGRARGAHDKTLEWVRSHNPDLVICTGDLVEHPDALPRFERFASQLVEASSQIFAVLGNWERRQNEEFTRKLVGGYRRAGLPILSNESTRLQEGLVVAAGDDPITDHFDSQKTFADLPDGSAYLFAVHSPIVFDRSDPQSPSFDLCLAGHTHGGQFRLGSWAPVTPRGSGRFTSGWYETDLGDAYVSRGIGMTFIRGRFLCPPELPIFTLRQA